MTEAVTTSKKTARVAETTSSGGAVELAEPIEPAEAARPVESAHPDRPAEPGESAEAHQLAPPEHWLGRPTTYENDSAFGEDTASSTDSVTSSIMRYRTLNGRTYHSERAGGAYWGANDERQNEALDIQNQVYELSLNGALYLAPLPENIEKAIDIGTGTGVWAIDFAEQFPNCTVYGTDLSPIQPTWVPPNVHFQIEDFTQEWTFKENSLDYIHMRWLVGSVPDWNKLFKEAYKALKPGGWIESYDCDAAFDSDDGSVLPKSALSQWVLIYREGAKKLGLNAPVDVVSLGLQRKAVESNNFINVHEKRIKIPTSEWAKDPKLKEIGLYQRCALESDIEGFVGLFASQVGFSKDAILLYAASVQKEARDPKIHSYSLFNIVWAQKPLNG